MSRIQPRSRRPSIFNDRVTVILMAVFVVIAIVTAIVAFNVVRNFTAGQNMFDLPGISVGNDSGQPAASGGSPDATVPAPVGALQSGEGPESKAWDGVSRVNILVMGLDFRDWEAGEIPRTDTMVLFTIDPLSKTAGMLSIPRDLWVNIPGYDYYKINTAYFLGAKDQVPGGGPGLAMRTVSEFLGVPVDYYAQIDFNAFIQFIDDIKGVKLDIPYEIKIDPLGKNNTIILPPGRITLDGASALAYARNRKTDGGDFDRAARTQQVILGIRDRILDFNMLPNLIANAPKLYNDLSTGIATNLSLEQIIQLALLAKDIPDQSIRQAIIGTEEVTFGTSPDGLDILKPISDKVRIKRDEIFTTGGPVSPAAVASDSTELMKQEAARISVQNATLTAGLAGDTSTYFKAQGMNVVEETNAQLTATSMLIDYTGKPYTLAYLAKLMNIPTTRIYSRYDPNAQIDVAVVLGDDWVNQNPMGQ